LPVYFAYGSNLSQRRLRERIGAASPLGIARLTDYRLVCDKLGADGSAKANLSPAPGGVVLGASYRVTEAALAILDGFEGGYDRVTLRVQPLAGGDARQVQPSDGGDARRVQPSDGGDARQVWSPTTRARPAPAPCPMPGTGT
jgi:hypothetical protein